MDIFEFLLSDIFGLVLILAALFGVHFSYQLSGRWKGENWLMLAIFLFGVFLLYTAFHRWPYHMVHN